MKAILLAAGFGTRLKPITNTTPKCLVPIKNKPLIEYWLENLTNNGITSILINTHFLSEKVETYINNSKYKENCKLVYEKELLGTAGTLISNLDFIGDEECILIHADNFCLANLKEFINSHRNRPSSCLLTMMTFTTENPHLCGIVEIDNNNIVKSFYEKKTTAHGFIANGAVYILSKEFICDLKLKYKNCFEFTTEIIINYINKMYTYHTSDVFIDIGTVEMYNKANNLILNND
jgi:mannose-1-phosphate guanylyltransferase